jgi:hypothetical protein
MIGIARIINEKLYHNVFNQFLWLISTSTDSDFVSLVICKSRTAAMQVILNTVYDNLFHT